MQERSRLARDLHDAVAQKLFSIRAHARAAAVPAGPDRVRAGIEVVGALGAEAHAELRVVIDGLAPPDLEAGGLAESLRRCAELAGRAHGIPVTFTAAPLPALASCPGRGGAPIPGSAGGAAQPVTARRGGRRPGRPGEGPHAGSSWRWQTTGTGSCPRRRPAGSRWPRCGSARRR